MNETVSYWRHNKCGNKVLIYGTGVYCPHCRHGVTGGVTHVQFENPVRHVYRVGEPLESDGQHPRPHANGGLRWSSRYASDQ